MNHHDLLERFTSEQVANARRLIHFAMTPAGLIGLIAQVQLALRHPQNDAGTAAIGREFIRLAIEKLRENDLPVTALIAEMGNDPAEDTPGESAGNPAPN